MAGSENRGLTDGRGRRHRKLRLSVTDRCNFRCVYCMPREVRWVPRKELLTFEEMERLARLCVSLGVETIRLTGGEPLLRKGLPQLVESLAQLPQLRATCLTTNGLLLQELAAPLAGAGLLGATISLDSLRPDRFSEITGGSELTRVLQGLAAARRAGLPEVKVNTVIIRGVNDDELEHFARWGRNEGVIVRFIEFMPLNADRQWDHERTVPASEMLQRIGRLFPLVPEAPSHSPATRYRYADGQGELGLIASVTQPFCDRCDRLRITADGMLRTCLFADAETDLKAPLRSGASEAQLGDLLRKALARKEPGHRLPASGLRQSGRMMHAIGG